MPVPHIPAGYDALIPSLVVRGGAAAIDFYKALFGAEEVMRMPYPDGSGRLMHAELKILGRYVMLGDESPEMGAVSPHALNGPSPVSIFVYVPDTDAVYQRALALGSKSTFPPADMFWGDRMARITDPFGHQWTLGTHIRDVSPEECAAAAAKFACP